MAVYIKGDPVANATSYKLSEKKGSNYTQLAEASEINFEVSALGLVAGEHVLAVRASASGYADSDYSNEVVYVVEASDLTILRDDLDLFVGGLKATGVWHSDEKCRYSLIDVRAYRGKTVTMTGGANSLVYSFLKNGKSTDTTITTASYATGYTAPVVVSQANAVVEVVIPDDAVLLYNYAASDDKIFSPVSIVIHDAQPFTNVISIDPSSISLLDGGLNANGTWHNNSGAKCIVYDISEYRGDTIKLVGSNNGLIYSFLVNTNSMTVGAKPTYATGYSAPVVISNIMLVAAVIPENATYLYIYNNSSTKNYTPTAIEIMQHG